MDLLAPVKAVINKVKSQKETKKQADEKNAKLVKWQKKLEKAKAQYDLSVFDQRDYLYLGTRTIDQNINSNQAPNKYANNVNNIIYELVESQVDTTIPQPSVRPKRPNYEEESGMIEDSITNDLKELGIEQINDMNERITPIHGMSIICVDWDPDFDHNLYRGEHQLSSKHPKQLVPQPGVYDIQKMDYYFLLSDVTQEYVKRRYGVDMEEEEEYPEHTSLGSNKSAYTQSLDNDKLTEIVCFYKDDDGDIGKFVWINDTVLEDLPRYFCRRADVCTVCGALRGDKEVCDAPMSGMETTCGNDKWKNDLLEEETITEAIPIMNYLGEQVVLQPGTKVPFFRPTRYPIVIRTNVPQVFSLGGQSDVDIIRDQQDVIKKVITKAEEKVIKAGTVVKKIDSHNVKITDEVYQVIKGTQTELAHLGTMEIKADVSQDMAFAQEQYQIAKSMLGITDSFQGKEDASAKSGVAKQIQVQQASGRLLSKQFNKNRAFKELFEILFEHKLAFYDELRPYVAKDEQGKDIFSDFDKYAFLVQDASGKLYYNTDFLFSADAGDGIPKDKIFILNNANQQLQSGAIDQVQYWMILEGINYPKASQIRKQIEDRMQQQQQMAEAQAQMQAEQQAQQQKDPFNQLSQEHQQKFSQLPPEVQDSIKQQIGGAS